MDASAAVADTDANTDLLRRLDARVAELEARVAELERTQAGAQRRGGSRASTGGAGGGGSLDATAWSTTYQVAHLEVSETWIELHEPSARPQLQRLLRQVVDEEGPVTERLALDRVRRAWGLKRAGGRVQEAVDQALRQLVARGLAERVADALQSPGGELSLVRVPDEADEATKRGAEDVPLVELALALTRAAAEFGSAEEDDLTMQVAKLFGWTRRGGAIQERLDAALEHALGTGSLVRAGTRIAPAATGG